MRLRRLCLVESNARGHCERFYGSVSVVLFPVLIRKGEPDRDLATSVSTDKQKQRRYPRYVQSPTCYMLHAKTRPAKISADTLNLRV